jgi:ABC-2 type transport system permease protein
MKAVWIALANLRRMFRVRTNIFFVFVFPMVLILILGATFGGSASPRLGVVTTGSGPLGAALLRQLEQTPHLRVVAVSDPAALLTQVERGNMAAGVVIPPGYDAPSAPGSAATLRYLARPDQSSQRLGETVRGAVARQAPCSAPQDSPSCSTRLPASARPGPGYQDLSLVPAVSVTHATAGTAPVLEDARSSSMRGPGPSSCSSCSSSP